MIKLRKLEPDDLSWLYRWENDAAVWAESATHNPLSQKDLREYILSTTGDIYRDGQLRLMIDKDGQTVGAVDLIAFDPRNRKAEVGIYIAAEQRGQGIGHEALRQVEQYAISILDMRLLYAYVSEKNIACRRCFEGVGYTSSNLLQGWTLESSVYLYLKQLLCSN